MIVSKIKYKSREKDCDLRVKLKILLEEEEVISQWRPKDENFKSLLLLSFHPRKGKLIAIEKTYWVWVQVYDK